MKSSGCYDIPTTAIGNFTTGCLLDYPYSKEYFKLIATDIAKEQALDAGPKKIQQVNFTGNVWEEATVFFIIEKNKRNHFKFFTRNCENIVNLFYFNIISM